MSICVESHYLQAGTAGNSLRVDGTGYIDPAYPTYPGTYAFLPSRTQTEVDCTGYLLQTAAEVRAHAESITSLTLETIGINPASIAYAFAWGLGSVLLIWSLGFAVGAASQAIKKI
jgi:hypothetical protein